VGIPTDPTEKNSISRANATGNPKTTSSVDNSPAAHSRKRDRDRIGGVPFTASSEIACLLSPLTDPKGTFLFLGRRSSNRSASLTHHTRQQSHWPRQEAPILSTTLGPRPGLFHLLTSWPVDLGLTPRLVLWTKTGRLLMRAYASEASRPTRRKRSRHRLENRL